MISAADLGFYFQTLDRLLADTMQYNLIEPCMTSQTYSLSLALNDPKFPNSAMTLSAVTAAKDLWDLLQPIPEHESLSVYLGHVTFDDDMWMLYTSTTNHMSPREKYFTNLDRTRKARVRLIDGRYILAQGTGDVIVMTKKGKKTIKNVLFVPGIVANVLSVGQLVNSGYAVQMGSEKWTIRDPTGKLFGETGRWEERGVFLRFQVIES